MHVAVIGAGPAGLAAAYELARWGVNLTVLEKEGEVGGLCRSLRLWGHTVDLGPHRFYSSDRAVTRLWLRFAGRDWRTVDRLTRIYTRGRFFLYPIKPGDVLLKAGPFEAARCLGSYLKQKAAGGRLDESTFEGWVVRRFGKRLYETFFRSYSEKLWGIAPCELDADFAVQRIRSFSLGEALRDCLGLGHRKHATLADRFPHPTGGTGMIYRRMAQAVECCGNHILKGTAAHRIVVEDSQVRAVRTEHGDIACDHVIATLPLPELLAALQQCVPSEVQSACSELRYRSSILVYLLVDRPDLFPDQWLYIHEPKLRVGRITNSRNWLPELAGDPATTVLTCEYWCNKGDRFWRTHDLHLIDFSRRELEATGLLGGASVVDGFVVRLPAAYPVYRRGYRAQVGRIAQFLQGIKGLLVVGRAAAFRYNNQDHSVIMGTRAARQLLGLDRCDLWEEARREGGYLEGVELREVGLAES